MDEHTNQDIQEDDNPAPTGLQSTRSPRRQRGAWAQRRPTQTEILTGNVQALTQTVQVLMEAFRNTHNQLPQRRTEAAESTPSRLPRSASRRRDPSPTAARSGRSHLESAERQQHEEGESSRMRSTSRRSRINPLEAPEQPAPTGDNPGDDRREVVNIRRNTPSVFDCLGRPEIYRRLSREASVDKPAERENRDQSRLDHLQRQLDRLIGQQCGLEPPGSADSPFTPSIMASPYPSSANEAALCKSFCLTLTGAARQWYWRLPPASIDSFQQLVSSFLATFLGSRTRKLGDSHLFSIKQHENETLKRYLERFDKAVVQVEDCTDDTLTQALREGINDSRLVWTLAYDREEPRGRNPCRSRSQPENASGEVPTIHPAGHYDRARPQPGVWSRITPRPTSNPDGPFPEESEQILSFSTRMWAMTPRIDQIKLLIREGHLREFVEKIITPVGQDNRDAPAAQQNPGPSNWTEGPEPEHIVHTIFGGTATGDTASSKRSYAREARRFARGEYINMAGHISKICRQDSPPITFTDDEADRLLHPHNDVLVGEIRVANNVVRRVLIDNGSSADVMFMDAFSRLKIEGATLTPVKTPLYGFVGDYVRAAGTVRLPVTIGDGPEKATRMVEFIVVDRPSVYNVILGRPTLNALKAVVSTYHLAMKFPTGNGIGVFRGNQEGARKCYMEAVNKVCWKAPAPVTVATILAVDEAGILSGEVKPLADLDPRMPEEEIRALPVEDLIPFQLDPERPERTVPKPGNPKGQLDQDPFAFAGISTPMVLGPQSPILAGTPTPVVLGPQS
ncbi:hypothetical protein TIFTF001_030447 [Ficus carica]|uniref:Retrotransposon gag domain-containing protein n=1 Tax=Ficus carica TaxID=3494 RepID=A0AA88DU78_FICCA|nr:hypothetical protein TIFTF001_030447 [Ficus carica]